LTPQTLETWINLKSVVPEIGSVNREIFPLNSEQQKRMPLFAYLPVPPEYQLGHLDCCLVCG
jgi:hypothetical protein